MITRKDLQFMATCKSMAKTFATCGKRQYGCLLVDDLGHVVGFGYNGGPKGFVHCDEGGCPRLQQNSPSGSSYDNCIAIHAEMNAFLHSDYSAKPTKLYVNGPPCFTCAKLIANSTVEHVYYIEDTSYVTWPEIENFLALAGVATWKVDNASL